MKKYSIKTYSLVGFVLLTASAVTASILPSKTKEEIPGKFIFDSTHGVVDDETTCKPSELDECKVTVPTCSTTDGNPNNGRQPHGTSIPNTFGNTTT